MNNDHTHKFPSMKFSEDVFIIEENICAEFQKQRYWLSRCKIQVDTDCQKGVVIVSPPLFLRAENLHMMFHIEILRNGESLNLIALLTVELYNSDTENKMPCPVLRPRFQDLKFLGENFTSIFSSWPKNHKNRGLDQLSSSEIYPKKVLETPTRPHP